MEQKPQFGKIHIIETYYKGVVASKQQETEEQKKTNKRNYLADIMDITAPLLTGKCTEVTLTIKAKDNEPHLIEVKKRTSLIQDTHWRTIKNK